MYLVGDCFITELTAHPTLDLKPCSVFCRDDDGPKPPEKSSEETAAPPEKKKEVKKTVKISSKV